MIEIVDKKNCNGCNACGDICPVDAITFQTDEEGFWYPQIDQGKCTQCGLCDKICPELHAELTWVQPLDQADCYAVQHVDFSTRKDSTSGGLFSALATTIFDAGGYVAGAVYNEDFSVHHIVTNNREDLPELRSSKYLQSSLIGVYKEIKKLLNGNEKVLFAGCPCHVSGLKLFLQKDYESLVTVDFVCRGINSPMIYQNYLRSLEAQYGSKAVKLKAKSKDLGWRNLTIRVDFENGQTYHGTRDIDPYTIGYLSTGVFCRPSCYDCKFKAHSRTADITMGDFWGIEKIDSTGSLDDDMGTSLCICSTDKGRTLFEKTKPLLKAEAVSLNDMLPGNRSFFESLPTSPVDRNAFYRDASSMPFDQVAKKYFCSVTKKKKNLYWYSRALLSRFKLLYKYMQLSPRAWWQFVYINFLRKNTHANFRKGHYLIPTPNCAFDLHPKAKMELNDIFVVGRRFVRGSRMETRLKMGENALLQINGLFRVSNGNDIQIFPGGKFIVDGEAHSGTNINCQIICASEIHWGKRTFCGRSVVIRDYDAHWIDIPEYKIKAPIHIGNNCWIGEGAYIAKGVTIGDGSVVAAHSMVVSNVKPNSLVGGSPAMRLKKDIKWWP